MSLNLTVQVSLYHLLCLNLTVQVSLYLPVCLNLTVQVSAGNIAVLSGLKLAVTGDTLVASEVGADICRNMFEDTKNCL